MGQQRYIHAGIPNSASLSSDTILASVNSVSIPPPGSYPDFTPPTAVSSFNIPASCDASLLTPISSAASPPLHQARDLVRQYPVPPGTPQSQGSDSTDEHKMYHQWSSHFDMNGHPSHPSGTSSPVNSQASVHPYSNPYIQEDRRTPGPPDPPSPTWPPLDDHQSPMPMRDASQMTMQAASQRELERSMSAQAMHSPQPTHMQQDRRQSTEGGMFHNFTTNNMERAVGPPPVRRVVQSNGKVKKSRSRRQSRAIPRPLDASMEHKNCRGQEVLPTFTDDIPAQERCIWESRWRHRDKKGHNMWKHILEDFEKQFKGQKVPRGRSARENLQMKFKRSRCRYLSWLPEDDKILYEAFIQVERDRYRTILDKFHELGGSRNMCLGAEDIEVRLANHLRLEDNLYMDDNEDLKLRRRRRTRPMARKLSNYDDSMSHMAMETDTQDVVAMPEPDVNAIINQVFEYRQIKEEESMSDQDDIMESQPWGRHPGLKMEPGH
ncbi:hypothetical protein B0I35DRAFT_478286 [Stachybotrys elegans]|uniref:Uncharacterized protein n=1 Tax=Stachybotrys elegans TaxID=80388 RepID=A0A8K0SWT0_9HYPO|nr:hypothetical protein B0I35DRAFT_478286 [Stachybotrys elegans]